MPLRTIKKHHKFPLLEYIKPASVIFIVVWWIVFTRYSFVTQPQSNEQTTNTNQTITTTWSTGSKTVTTSNTLLDRKVGNTINIEWIITASSDSTTRNSHILVTSDNIKYGLVTINVALWWTDGYTSVEGTIVDIINALPIVEVKKITALNESSFKRESWVRYLDKLWITLNPSLITNATAEVSGSTITIQTPAWTTIVSAFVCGSSRNNNCKRMLQDLEKPDTQSFAWSNGQLYYQLWSPQEWFTAHTDVLRGYRFSVPNDQALVEASQIINIIDKQFIEWSLLSDVKRICSSQWEISNINSINFVTVEPSPILRIIATTEQKKTINCTAKLSLNEPLPLIAINVSVEWWNTQNTNTSVNTSPESTISYKTTEWLTLLWPEDSVNVRSMLSRENFGIIGLRCPQKLSLTPKQETEWTGNVAMIYLCQSQWPANQLINEQTKKLTHIMASGGQHVYIQLNNPERLGFVESVTVQ